MYGTWNYSYDNEGNMTGKEDPVTGEKWTYGYDHHNELIKVEHQATATDPIDLRVEFKYDALGNRVEKSVDDDGDGPNDPVITRFAYDGWNPAKSSSLSPWGRGAGGEGPIGTENFDVLADLNADGSLKTRYFRGDVVDQLFARLDYDATTLTPHWYLTDHQGTIRDIVDADGDLQGTVSYDAFGNITSDTSARGRYGYTGREIDEEIHLEYNRARYYSPELGRWITQDPLSFDAGDSNLYRYVNNRPTYATDPSGKILVANERWTAMQYAKWFGELGIVTTFAKAEDAFTDEPALFGVRKGTLGRFVFYADPASVKKVMDNYQPGSHEYRVLRALANESNEEVFWRIENLPSKWYHMAYRKSSATLSS